MLQTLTRRLFIPRHVGSFFAAFFTWAYIPIVAEEDAPSGMLARGHYTATSTFVDDDKKTHLQFEWAFDIAKEW